MKSIRWHWQKIVIHTNNVVQMFACSFLIPMPQLTPQYERVIIYGLLHSDDKNYEQLQQIKIAQMVQEIRISEDYCRSDIIVFDTANVTLAHISKLSVLNFKKFELCALVSSVVIRNVFNVPRNIVISGHIGVSLHITLRILWNHTINCPRHKTLNCEMTCKCLKSLRSSFKYGRFFQHFPQRKMKTRKSLVNTQTALNHTFNMSSIHHTVYLPSQQNQHLFALPHNSCN
jgi:hypothetical protein